MEKISLSILFTYNVKLRRRSVRDNLIFFCSHWLWNIPLLLFYISNKMKAMEWSFLRKKSFLKRGGKGRDSSRNKVNNPAVTLAKLLHGQTPVYLFMSLLQVGWTQVVNFASYYFKCEEGILLLPLLSASLQQILSSKKKKPQSFWHNYLISLEMNTEIDR